MVPHAVARAVAASQISVATAWADRMGWRLHYEQSYLLGVAVAPAAEVAGLVRPEIAFYFDVAGYDAEPPAWWCGPVPGAGAAGEELTGLMSTMGVDDDKADLVQRASMANRDSSYYPAPASHTLTNGPNGSIFHPNAVICAPWNRLAFQAHGGIHGDWTSTVDWKTTATQYTQAHTIGDMLSTLHLHLRASPGRVAAA
jgi:hypothetical protein